MHICSVLSVQNHPAESENKQYLINLYINSHTTCRLCYTHQRLKIRAKLQQCLQCTDVTLCASNVKCCLSFDSSVYLKYSNIISFLTVTIRLLFSISVIVISMHISTLPLLPVNLS